MQCRNCGSNLEEEFRYCPRCGAPGSLGWPAAGGPWLRRPAAVAGLALMVIAWLAALQRQLWLSGRPPASSPPAHSAWLAARPPTPLALSRADRPVPGTPGAVILAPRSLQPGALVRNRAPTEPGRGASRQEFAARIAAAPSAAMIAPATSTRRRPARGRLQHTAVSIRPADSRGLRAAALPHRAWPDLAARALPGHRVDQHSQPSHTRRAADPWSRLPVLVQSPGRLSGEPITGSPNLIVNISARPYGLKTFVYLDGGRELGIAPLQVRFDRPGRHKLLFFASSLGAHGRATKVIDVRRPSRQWVSVTMGPSREFARRGGD